MTNFFRIRILFLLLSLFVLNFSEGKRKCKIRKCKPKSCSTTEGAICTTEYKPVCGLFDPSKIQCIIAPCGKTYCNRCHALNDPIVIKILDCVCPVGREEC